MLWEGDGKSMRPVEEVAEECWGELANPSSPG